MQTQSQTEPYLKIEESPLIFVILVAALGGCLAASLAVASKIVDIFGFTPSATVIGYSVTFICTDCISELFGRRRANQAVLAGFIAFVIATFVYWVAIAIPGADFWSAQLVPPLDSEQSIENAPRLQDAFESVFGISFRVAIAGIVAYLASQFHDVWAFHFWRERTNAKYLWLRNNLSTMTSQFIDTVIFVTIAFYGVFPILPVIIGQYVVKLGIALIDTPIVYAIVGFARGKTTSSSTAT